MMLTNDLSWRETIWIKAVSISVQVAHKDTLHLNFGLAL